MTDSPRIDWYHSRQLEVLEGLWIHRLGDCAADSALDLTRLSAWGLAEHSSGCERETAAHPVRGLGLEAALFGGPGSRGAQCSRVSRQRYPISRVGGEDQRARDADGC